MERIPRNEDIPVKFLGAREEEVMFLYDKCLIQKLS